MRMPGILRRFAEAGVVVPGGQRLRTKEVCRYVLRPPVASARLGDG